MWDTAKVVLRGKFTAPNAIIKKEEKSQNSNLSSHVKKLEKEEQKTKTNWKQTNKKPKAGRRKEIIEINETRNRKVIEEINEIKF